LPAQIVLGAAFLYGVYCHVFDSPGYYVQTARLRGFHILAIAAGLTGSAYLCVHLRASLRRARFALLIVTFAAMGASLIRASPRPWIDVFVLRELAGQGLAQGENPYSLTYPDIYRKSGLSEKMYGPGLIDKDGRLTAYPYQPLVPMLDSLPARLGIDVRYLSLLAMIGAAIAMAAIGGVTGELAAMAMLFQGRSFFVLEQAWTDAPVLLAFCLALLAVTRGWLWSGLSIGLMLAAKQIAPLLAIPLFFAIPRGERLKSALLAVAILASTFAPFYLWDREGFMRGVVYNQFWQPLREDSLSWLAFAARHGMAFGVWAAAALAVLALVCGVRSKIGPGRAAATAGAAWIVFVLFNKQGHTNYYWLGEGLLCAAAAAFAREVSPT
jgi:hypothetical protein